MSSTRSGDRYSIFFISPRRVWQRSISAPVYCVGVMIDSLKNGSSMLAIFCASGRSAGLSTTCSVPSVRVHAVLDARRRGDERQAELALEPLLDDLHVQQTEEAAAESEPERAGRLGRVA